MNLQPDDLERYKRQLILPGFSNRSQEKLKGARVLVAGAGGLGSPVLHYLAAAGVGHLVVYDPDRVRLDNLNRQVIHSTTRINWLKANSAAEALRRLNPQIKITARPEFITASNVTLACRKAHVLVDCLDNFYTRRLLNGEAIRRKIPLVHAGLKGLGGQIGVFHYPHGPCLECLLPKASSPETIPVLGAIPAVLGALEALEVIKLLTGLGRPLIGRVLFFDGFETSFVEMNIERDPLCSACGSREKTT